MEVGQKVVFVRDAKGAEVGKHGTVIGVSDNLVTVECRLEERVTPVLAQMWDVLPERLWNHLLKHRGDWRPMTVPTLGSAPDRTSVSLRAAPK
jgi:hypothetical protein